MINESTILWRDETIDKIMVKMAWVSEKSKNKIPYTTQEGVHDDRSAEDSSWDLDNGINWWTNGFWGGMMWLMFHETKKDRYAEIARLSEKKLDQSLEDFYGLHHDVGFMWLLTSVADYRLTKDADARRRGLHAANLLAGRFNPAGDFIRAWHDRTDEKQSYAGWVIIDSMLNIPLLYWAEQEMKDPRFGHIARRHADTVMKYFIRPDGSAEHIVEFDPETGAKLRTHGGQGYADGSSWTRGQAWALYGFVISYLHTECELYLNTAKRVAHYFISNIREDGLVPVDFRQPEGVEREDCSAAAIAACGLLELAGCVPSCEQELYIEPALRLLQTLTYKRCNWGTSSDCILENCTAAYHGGVQEGSLIYGDYFFMEAMFKLRESRIFLW